jgi:hypothetical protein
MDTVAFRTGLARALTGANWHFEAAAETWPSLLSRILPGLPHRDSDVVVHSTIPEMGAEMGHFN